MAENLHRDKILISIITPVFNRMDVIGRCMDSVSRAIKSYGDDSIFEHIIIDDGSRDDTPVIIENFAKSNPYISPIFFENNRGTNAARNAGISVAKGKWCLLLDSDDYLDDKALINIIQTISEYPGYKHYMFAHDDMDVYLKKYDIIRGKEIVELTYEDLLSKKVEADFIHLASAEILRNHPFSETLRIHEGLFFLLFYKDAQKMLFRNILIAYLERNRADSVSQEFLRIGKQNIRNKLIASSMKLELFEKEMRELGMNTEIDALKISVIDNSLLLQDYKTASKALKDLGLKNKKVVFLKGINSLKLGGLYRVVLKSYLVLKYRVFKKSLR